MKIILSISTVLILLSSPGCSTKDGTSGPDDPLGSMTIEITQTDGNEEDRMETVRFIVFNNIYSTPELELNSLFDIPPTSPQDGEVSAFRITLELKRKAGGTNNKMVVAIVNEPQSMKNELDGIAGLPALEALELDFAHFLDQQHLGLLDGKTMPMTGVIRSNKIFATPDQANADPVRINLLRAAAKIEVYIDKEAGLDIDLGSGTTVSLANTYDSEFFVSQQEGSEIFGNIKTLTSGFLTKRWTISPSDPKYIPESAPGEKGRLACSFYTPERSCFAGSNADKLVLSIEVVTSEGARRTAEVTMDRMTTSGTVKNIESILRNNNYAIKATVGSQEITAKVVDWNDVNIVPDF